MSLLRYDAIELDDVLIAAGFTDYASRRKAWGVAMRESRGTPAIMGGPNGNGSYDFGLFQINDVHRADTAIDWDKILDGAYNASIAYRWTDGGVDWSTWGLGSTGWAGWLKDHAPETWAQVQRDFQVQYIAYPAALAAARDLRLRPPVTMSNVKPGVRNDDVLAYQTALRTYLTKAGMDVTLLAINPSGATGFYGQETRAMTAAAYTHAARITGDKGWLRGDITTPGPSLVMRLGLRPA